MPLDALRSGGGAVGYESVLRFIGRRPEMTAGGRKTRKAQLVAAPFRCP